MTDHDSDKVDPFHDFTVPEDADFTTSADPTEGETVADNGEPGDDDDE